MKIITNLLLSFLLVSIASQGQEKKLAVLAYGTNDQYYEFIQNELITAFNDDGTYTVFERQQEFLDMIAKEHSFQQSGWVRDKDIIDMARKAGAEYVCAFKMLNLVFGEQPIAARILSVESGKVVRSVQWSGEWNSMNNMRSAVKVITSKLTRSKDL